jgi:hypothetical protein
MAARNGLTAGQLWRLRLRGASQCGVKRRYDRHVTDSDRFGWLGKPARPRIATSAVLRVLWRMQGRTRIVTAALYDHPVGTELRVYLEPESANDLLNSHVERFDIGVLETRAEALRAILLEKGWTDAATVN